MRTRTIATATALAVLFSSAALVAVASGPAAADSAKLLDVKSAADVLVDGAHQRVYVSDPVEGKIVVTDYTGAVKATLDGLPDVDGLALSPDSGQVYAAVAGLDRIVSVDTSSYTQSASYKLDGAERPRTLAMASGKLWFGYGPDTEGASARSTSPAVGRSSRSARTATRVSPPRPNWGPTRTRGSSWPVRRRRATTP